MIIKDTLLVSAFSFAVKGFCYLIQHLSTQNHFSSLQPPEDSYIGEFDDTIYNFLHDFTSFMILMSICAILITGVKLIYQHFQNKNKQRQSYIVFNPSKTNQADSWIIKQRSGDLCKLLICYTAIFGCYQLSLALFSNTFPNQKSILLHSENYHHPALIFNNELSTFPESQGSYRHLGQVLSESEESIDRLILTPSLNPGEILGKFDYRAETKSTGVGLVLSRDGNTLFLFHDLRLEIYNISNPERVVRLSSLRIAISEASFGSVSMLHLSLDEKTLYILSTCQNMRIDISDLRNPDDAQSNEHPLSLYNSMVTSSDGKTLYYVTAKVFRIYDISSPYSEGTKLLRELKGEHGGGIAISSDNTKVVLGFQNKFRILNVTDPSKPTLICAKNVTGQIFSISFSSDESKILLGSIEESDVSSVNLQTFDITNPKKPYLLSSVPLSDDIGLGSCGLWFHSNKDFVFMYTASEFNLIRIADVNSVTLFSKSSGIFTRPFAASANNERNVLFFDGQIIIMKFYIDVVRPDLLYVSKPNSLKIFERDSQRKEVIALSKDEKTLYLVQKTNFSQPNLIPYKRVSEASFEPQSPIPLFEFPNPIKSRLSRWNIIAGDNLVIVKAANFDSSRYSTDGPNLFVLNKTNNYEKILDINQNPLYRHEILAVALSEDERALAFIKDLTNQDTNLTLNIIILRGGKVENAVVDFKLPTQNCPKGIPLLKFSKNSQFLFYANCGLLVYNLSNFGLPVWPEMSRFKFSRISAFTFSNNEEILYLIATNLTSNALHVFNTSGLRDPKLLYEESVPLEAKIEFIEFSSEKKILFLGAMSMGLMMYDVQVPSSPRGFGASYLLEENYALTCLNDKKLCYTASESGVTSFDLRSNYILYLKNTEFKVGGSYSVVLNVLKMNKNFKSDYLGKKHKFIKAFLFDVTSTALAGKPYKALPSWLALDKERSLITIEPRSASTIRDYWVSVILSTQVQPSDFVGLKAISNETEAEDLMLKLLQYGYIDNQGFISKNLDFSQKLWLDSQYKEIERDIRYVFSKNYFEAQSFISISPSLNLSDTKPFKISSLSTGTISVTIQLNKTNDKAPYFLASSSSNLKPVITHEGSVLTLQGPLNSVNEALEGVFIDLDQLSFCDGLINVTDEINPPISRSIVNISDYFIAGKESIGTSEKNHLIIRSINPDYLKVEVHLASDLDESVLPENQPHFVNKRLSSSRFSISTNKSVLYLEGSMTDINKALREVLIDLGSLENCEGWIRITDQINIPKYHYLENISDHFLKNAIPEYNESLPLQAQINNRPFFTGLYSTIDLNANTFYDRNNLTLEYEFIMQNSQDGMPQWLTFRGLSLIGTGPEKFPSPSYKMALIVKNEFKTIKIPFTLDIKLSFSYIVQLLIKYVGSLFSLVGFLVAMPKIYNILAKRYYRYPRSFKLRFGEEISNKRIFPVYFIKAEIEQSKMIFAKLQKEVASKNGEIAAEYFRNPQSQNLDREKILATLQAIKNKDSNGWDNISHEIVHQLVINMILMEQLANKKETVTRNIFDKIKNKWMDLVVVTSSEPSSQFTINSANLQQALENLSMHSELSMKKNLNFDETNLSTESLLFNRETINMDLLENAITAYAFSFQNLNIETIKIDILSYKKKRGNSCLDWIKGFFLRDLEAFAFLNKRELGYGIKYKIQGNVLRFFGQLTDELKDDTIVIHLKSTRGMILREICINEENLGVRNQSYMESISEEL